MYYLPINRENDSWDKINKEFSKGVFDWYNQRFLIGEDGIINIGR